MDYSNIAKDIFDRTKYEAPEEDVKRLAANMAILEKRGLNELNNRLVDARKHSKILETIAEHNFAAILVSSHGATVPISYEPAMGLRQRPPDFKIELNGNVFWLQMKDLSKLERENRQNKLIRQIEGRAKEIKVGKFYGLMLSDDFKKDCVTELIKFMEEKAASAVDGEALRFVSKNGQTAEVEFWSPNRMNLSELTLGCSGDIETVDITGQDNNQIKQSLINAAGAFTWETDRCNINLIVMEADNKLDINICEAIFGTEVELPHTWTRKNDGFFKDLIFATTVAGIIALKRKPEKSELPPAEEIKKHASKFGMTPDECEEALEWWGPCIADYYRILYVNDSYKYLLEGIKKCLSLDKVIYYNMRPEMGKGNFKI